MWDKATRLGELAIIAFVGTFLVVTLRTRLEPVVLIDEVAPSGGIYIDLPDLDENRVSFDVTTANLERIEKWSEESRMLILTTQVELLGAEGSEILKLQNSL